MIGVGLDFSLAATGMARLDTETGHAQLRTLKTGNRRGHERLEYIATEIVEFIRGADHIAIELAAFAASSSSRTDIDGMHGLLKHLIWRRRIPYALIPPTSLKLYVTGEGTAGKLDVMKELQRTFPSVVIDDDNQADALALATMLLRFKNLPVDAHRTRWPHALEKCFWPDQDGEPRIIRKPKRKPGVR